jgi:hypothetical protein
MNTNGNSEPATPDARQVLAAMERAAELARRTAIQTDTAIVMVKDGKRVRVTAAELREQKASNTP